MAKQKKQHYVPKCLLKNFCDNNRKFYVYQTNSNIITDKSIPFDSQCQEDYLYGEDGEIETELSTIENETAPIFAKIENNEQLSAEDENVLKKFIMIQHFRTLKSANLQQTQTFNMYLHIIPSITSAVGIQLDTNEIDRIAYKLIQEKPSTAILQDHIEYTKANFSEISDLQLFIIKSNGIKSFAISDHPVIMCNPCFPIYGVGYEMAGIILYMPISSTRYAVLIDKSMYDYSYYLDADLSYEYLKQLNYEQYLNSEKTLYSQSRDVLTEIKNYFDSIYLDNIWRQIYISSGVTDMFEINKRIKVLQEENSKIYNSFPVKYYAQAQKTKTNFWSKLIIRKAFLSYTKNINAPFRRKIDINGIESFKYSAVSPKYLSLIQEYLKDV